MALLNKRQTTTAQRRIRRVCFSNKACLTRMIVLTVVFSVLFLIIVILIALKKRIKNALRKHKERKQMAQQEQSQRNIEEDVQFASLSQVTNPYEPHGTLRDEDSLAYSYKNDEGILSGGGRIVPYGDSRNGYAAVPLHAEQETEKPFLKRAIL